MSINIKLNTILLLAVIIIASNIYSQSQTHSVKKGLIISLSFNNSFADNANNLPGIETNNVKFVADRYGKKNSAVAFNGTDSYIKVPLNINPDALPEERAESVRSWLIKNGISSSRMKYKGMGESSPVASNKTKEGKALNRRVEIILQ